VTDAGPDIALREYDSLADRIRLHRQADPRSVIVVEGMSDHRLLRTLVTDSQAVVFVGGTRSAVLGVASSNALANFDRLVCIVDRDFDDVVAEAIDEGFPVVAYDGADVEDMLMGSPSGIRLIEEFASAEKLSDFGIERLLERVHIECSKLARLRRANSIHAWGLNFVDADVASKIDRRSLEISMLRLCAALLQASSVDVTCHELETTAVDGAIIECPRSRRRLLRGRDQLAVIGVALRRVIGNRTKAQTEPEVLASALRASAQTDWLRTSAWFAEVTALAGIV
jgi:hypothetical protein